MVDLAPSGKGLHKAKHRTNSRPKSLPKAKAKATIKANEAVQIQLAPKIRGSWKQNWHSFLQPAAASFAQLNVKSQTQQTESEYQTTETDVGESTNWTSSTTNLSFNSFPWSQTSSMPQQSQSQQSQKIGTRMAIEFEKDQNVSGQLQLKIVEKQCDVGDIDAQNSISNRQAQGQGYKSVKDQLFEQYQRSKQIKQQSEQKTKAIREMKFKQSDQLSKLEQQCLKQVLSGHHRTNKDYQDNQSLQQKLNYRSPEKLKVNHTQERQPYQAQDYEQTWTKNQQQTTWTAQQQLDSEVLSPAVIKENLKELRKVQLQQQLQKQHAEMNQCNAKKLKPKCFPNQKNYVSTSSAKWKYQNQYNQPKKVKHIMAKIKKSTQSSTSSLMDNSKASEQQQNKVNETWEWDKDIEQKEIDQEQDQVAEEFENETHLQEGKAINGDLDEFQQSTQYQSQTETQTPQIELNTLTDEVDENINTEIELLFRRQQDKALWAWFAGKRSEQIQKFTNETLRQIRQGTVSPNATLGDLIGEVAAQAQPRWKDGDKKEVVDLDSQPGNNSQQISPDLATGAVVYVPQEEAINKNGNSNGQINLVDRSSLPSTIRLPSSCYNSSWFGSTRVDQIQQVLLEEAPCQKRSSRHSPMNVNFGFDGEEKEQQQLQKEQNTTNPNGNASKNTNTALQVDNNKGFSGFPMDSSPANLFNLWGPMKPTNTSNANQLKQNYAQLKEEATADKINQAKQRVQQTLLNSSNLTFPKAVKQQQQPPVVNVEAKTPGSVSTSSASVHTQKTKTPQSIASTNTSNSNATASSSEANQQQEPQNQKVQPAAKSQQIQQSTQTQSTQQKTQWQKFLKASGSKKYLTSPSPGKQSMARSVSERSLSNNGIQGFQSYSKSPQWRQRTMQHSASGAIVRKPSLKDIIEVPPYSDLQTQQTPPDPDFKSNPSAESETMREEKAQMKRTPSKERFVNPSQWNIGQTQISGTAKPDPNKFLKAGSKSGKPSTFGLGKPPISPDKPKKKVQQHTDNPTQQHKWYFTTKDEKEKSQPQDVADQQQQQDQNQNQPQFQNQNVRQEIVNSVVDIVSNRMSMALATALVGNEQGKQQKLMNNATTNSINQIRTYNSPFNNTNYTQAWAPQWQVPQPTSARRNQQYVANKYEVVQVERNSQAQGAFRKSSIEERANIDSVIDAEIQNAIAAQNQQQTWNPNPNPAIWVEQQTWQLYGNSKSKPVPNYMRALNKKSPRGERLRNSANNQQGQLTSRGVNPSPQPERPGSTKQTWTNANATAATLQSSRRTSKRHSLPGGVNSGLINYNYAPPPRQGSGSTNAAISSTAPYTARNNREPSISRDQTPFAMQNYQKSANTEQNNNLIPSGVLYHGPIQILPVDDAAREQIQQQQSADNLGDDQQLVVKLKPNVDVPSVRAYAASAMVGHTLYIFGGTTDTNFGNTPFDDLWILNLAEMKWCKYDHTKYNNGSGSPGPGPRCKHSMISWNGKLILFGGWNGSRRCHDLWIFETQKMLWREVTDERFTGNYHTSDACWPPPHTSHAVTLVNDVMIVVGRGETGTHKKYGCDIDFFDCASETWVLGGARFNSRAGHSMSIQADGRILMLGGRKDNHIETFKVADYCPDKVMKEQLKKPQFGVNGESQQQKTIKGIKAVGPPYGRSFHGMVPVLDGRFFLCHGGFLEGNIWTVRCLYDATKNILLYEAETQGWYELNIVDSEHYKFIQQSALPSPADSDISAPDNLTSNNRNSSYSYNYQPAPRSSSKSRQQQPSPSASSSNLQALLNNQQSQHSWTVPGTGNNSCLRLLPNRGAHCMEWFVENDKVKILLFGGTDRGRNFNDLWLLELQIIDQEEHQLQLQQQYQFQNSGGIPSPLDPTYAGLNASPSQDDLWLLPQQISGEQQQQQQYSGTSSNLLDPAQIQQNAGGSTSGSQWYGPLSARGGIGMGMPSANSYQMSKARSMDPRAFMGEMGEYQRDQKKRIADAKKDAENIARLEKNYQRDLKSLQMRQRAQERTNPLIKSQGETFGSGDRRKQEQKEIDELSKRYDRLMGQYKNKNPANASMVAQWKQGMYSQSQGRAVGVAVASSASASASPSPQASPIGSANASPRLSPREQQQRRESQNMNSGKQTKRPPSQRNSVVGLVSVGTGAPWAWISSSSKATASQIQKNQKNLQQHQQSKAQAQSNGTSSSTVTTIWKQQLSPQPQPPRQLNLNQNQMSIMGHQSPELQQMHRSMSASTTRVDTFQQHQQQLQVQQRQQNLNQNQQQWQKQQKQYTINVQHHEWNLQQRQSQSGAFSNNQQQQFQFQHLSPGMNFRSTNIPNYGYTQLREGAHQQSLSAACSPLGTSRNINLSPNINIGIPPKPNPMQNASNGILRSAINTAINYSNSSQTSASQVGPGIDGGVFLQQQHWVEPYQETVVQYLSLAGSFDLSRRSQT